MDQSPIIRLDHVAKRYDPTGPQVLRDVSLSVAPGESLAVVGPSGCGKSTLLNILGALDRPTAGRVLLEGKDLAAMDERELAAVRSRKIGFVFQLHHLLPQLTVLENVLVPTLAVADTDRPAAQRRACELLERVGLSSRLDARPGALSGGERQRVAVARALINQPSLLLADEPTGSLDHATSAALAELFVEIRRSQGVTLIVVTHWQELARRMGSVLELRDGMLDGGWQGKPDTQVHPG